MGWRALHAEGQVPTKAWRCEILWDSGKNENVNMSQVAMVIPLFFLCSIFIAETLSLFILHILSWIVKRLSLFFLLFCLCTVALTLHFSGLCSAILVPLCALGTIVKHWLPLHMDSH